MRSSLFGPFEALCGSGSTVEQWSGGRISVPQRSPFAGLRRSFDALGRKSNVAGTSQLRLSVKSTSIKNEPKTKVGHLLDRFGSHLPAYA